MDGNMEYQSDTQTLLGKKEKVYIDTETGEKIYAEQITKRAYGQKQFWKIYLMDFLHILGLADSKQIDVLIYILQNTEQANNTFVGTYKKIAKEANVSEPTIAKIMKKLQENHFIIKVQNGVWQVSPNIMMKGSEHKKSLLLNYYDDSVQSKDDSE
ncbi:replication/maintenance protein RepL [Exiguobacterium sp. BRG2]|uniref:replication/maintenance protein RepL n=1 Tax=unclassified Exiguobacterium TaxID=2644629 RepID=UPI002881E743|nr:replication/maintenance protein RepL [Exiguobacterium sp. BRG2]MDT0174433.1 replication/maintenance protein RepL [Exiguobacterium sp. BRG2]